MRKLSLEEEMEIVICYVGGVPIRHICDRYGVSRSAVHRVVTRRGVETDRGKKAGR